MRKVMIAALASSMLFTTACGTTNMRQPQALSETPPNFTRNFMVRAYNGFDQSGQIRPWRPVTRLEADMIISASAQCQQLTNEVYGLALEYAKDGIKGGVLVGLSTAVGAVLGGFTKGPFSFGDYLTYAGVAGVGSGLFSASIRIDQMLSYVHFYCVTLVFDKNARDRDETRLGGVGRDLIILPVPGKARMPQIDPNVTTRFSAQYDDGSTPPPPPPSR